VPQGNAALKKWKVPTGIKARMTGITFRTGARTSTPNNFGQIDFSGVGDSYRMDHCHVVDLNSFAQVTASLQACGVTDHCVIQTHGGSFAHFF
jgi:hypothetical protein